VDKESSSLIKGTVLLGGCFLIFGSLVIFGESIWGPQLVKIRERSVKQSSTYTDARVAELRRSSIEICSPGTPKQNVPGLLTLFVQTADELKDTNIPDDLKEMVKLARNGKSFCAN
jgi:hypothetical protein